MLKIKRRGGQGLSRTVSIALFALVFVMMSAGNWAVSYATPAPFTTKIRGVITVDECATSTRPIGDVGCYIAVTGTNGSFYFKNARVQVLHGNAVQFHPWGKLIGFNPMTTNYKGRHVQVYAAYVSTNHYTLEGSSTYYAKLVN